MHIGAEVIKRNTDIWRQLKSETKIVMESSMITNGCGKIRVTKFDGTEKRKRNYNCLLL